MNQINPKDLNIIRGLPPVSIKGDRVSIDSEFFQQTKERLHRPHGLFAGVGCSFDGQTVYIITDEADVPEFYKRLDAAVHLYHNAKYDITQLRRFTRITQRKNLWDTMLIEQIMYSGYYNDFGLNDLARRYLDVYMSKDVREEFETSDTMSTEQIEYLAVDIVATWRIYKAQRAIIDDTDLGIWKSIELPFMWTLIGMSGIKLDVQKWLDLAEYNRKTAEDISNKYYKVEEVVNAKGKVKLVPSGINLASPLQVKKHLQSLGFDVDGTAVGDLEGLSDDSEFVRDLLMYRGCAKRSSTYGAKFVEDYVEADGHIYSSIYQIGAECMPAGELVLTSRGYISVEKVRLGDKVITHLGNTKPVTDVINNGAKKIIFVSLDNGLHLRTTENHPYLVDDGMEGVWVLAKNLKPFDSVVIHSEEERFVTIAGWEDFCISSWGRVYNQKTGRFLTLQPSDEWGHLKVMLVRNRARNRGDDRKDFRVHRLVAEAFVPGKSEINNEVRHLNGISWDNTDHNLCWGTALQNRQDAVKHGTMSHRYTSSQTKITDDMVSKIRKPEEYYRGRDQVLADEFGISREMVRDVRLGKRWQENYFEGKEKRATFYTSRVLEVLDDGIEITYGLQIQDDHSHVTSGIVTHNTARTSSRNPNLQNQPHEDKYRDCFIADDDGCLNVADWSSQEPRIAAYMSQDERLIEVFNSGRDIYIEIAKDVLGETIVKSDPRRKQIKALVLGIFYGMSAYGLGDRLGISKEEAQDMIDTFLKCYPGVKDYMDRQAKAGQYVESIYGRKIWLNKYDYQWTRNALNAPIQCSAAEAMKLAAHEFTVRIDGEDFYENCHLKLLVHDELVVGSGNDECETVAQCLKDSMIEVAEEMHDGIKASLEIFTGQSWACKV